MQQEAESRVVSSCRTLLNDLKVPLFESREHPAVSKRMRRHFQMFHLQRFHALLSLLHNVLVVDREHTVRDGKMVCTISKDGNEQ